MNISLRTAVGVSATLAAVLSTTACRQPTSPASSDRAALVTAWGDPNLQGIWTDVYETPLQRPA